MVEHLGNLHFTCSITVSPNLQRSFTLAPATHCWMAPWSARLAIFAASWYLVVTSELDKFSTTSSSASAPSTTSSSSFRCSYGAHDTTVVAHMRNGCAVGKACDAKLHLRYRFNNKKYDASPFAFKKELVGLSWLLGRESGQVATPDAPIGARI